MPTKKRLQR